jgi:hypothetical protein
MAMGAGVVGPLRWGRPTPTCPNPTCTPTATVVVHSHLSSIACKPCCIAGEHNHHNRHQPPIAIPPTLQPHPSPPHLLLLHVALSANSPPTARGTSSSPAEQMRGKPHPGCTTPFEPSRTVRRGSSWREDI